MRQRSWKDFGVLDLRTGRLSLSDTSFFWDAPFVLNVPPGHYVVEVDPSRDGLSDRAVRIAPDRDRIRPGQAFRRVLDVSFAQLAVCDRSIGDAILGYEQYYAELQRLPRPRGQIEMPTGEVMFVTYPAVGNAKFNVVTLETDDGICVGAEIDLTDWVDEDPEEPEDG